MSMRKQFVTTTEAVLAENKKTVLLLGDIGVFGFKKAFEAFPSRVYNIGILEQSTIGAAAGLSMSGLIPIVHTIAPFIVERAFEQLKDDFAFQKLGGNFVSVGASYDYAALGATHHCPGDIGELKNIPGMEIVVPGHAAEYDTLFKSAYANGNPTYFRLSERENKQSFPVQFGKAHVVKKGKKATVIAVGPILSRVMEACEKEDVTILYYTTLAPFDRETLKKNCPSGKILVCEPYYAGALAFDIQETFAGKPLSVVHAGMPHEFLTHYGKDAEHDELLGLTAKGIHKKLKKLLA
jgi:transketolase